MVFSQQVDLSQYILPQLTPLEAFGASIKSNSHTALDVAGMLPVVGAPADALNAVIYFAEGDYVNGTMSVAGMVPGAGEAVIAAKMANKGVKAVKGASKAVKAVDNIPGANKMASNALKQADNIPVNCKQAKSGMSTGCFTEGTQIVVGAEYDVDGVFVQYVTVNIEDIKVGDLVYSYDTLTGETELREVTKTMALQSNHINYLTFEDEFGVEQVIESTDVHPFWVVTDEPDLDRAARDYAFENGTWFEHGNLEITEYGYWVEAKDLRIGDVFLGANGELSVLTNIVRVEQSGGIAVFNFSVEGNCNYFILAKEYEFGQSCILVHNTTGGCYVLKDGEGTVRRTGRTKDLRSRELDHKKDFPDHPFETVYRTDDLPTQKGLEDMLYNEHIATARFDEVLNPEGLNKIRAVSETNPNKPDYVKAANNFLNKQ